MKRHYFELDSHSACAIDAPMQSKTKLQKVQPSRVGFRRKRIMLPTRFSIKNSPQLAWSILESRLRSSEHDVKKRKHRSSMVSGIAAGSLPAQGILTAHIDGVSAYVFNLLSYNISDVLSLRSSSLLHIPVPLKTILPQPPCNSVILKSVALSL